ncbi:hypothetical protein KAT63_01365 [Candidatus Parcubacteria bacterium]|nr:hypothetical protein [Candidatus Parcubacteria bacterium]
MKFLPIEIDKIEAVGIIAILFCIALMIECLAAGFAWTVGGFVVSSVVLVLIGGWQAPRINNDTKAT